MIHFFMALLLVTSLAHAQSAARRENLFQDKTKIENPFDLRDPFKAPRTRNTGKNKYATGKGEYTNILEADVQKLNLNEFRVVGVLIGKERRALVHANSQSKEVIILKEGMKLGPDQTELKAILPGGLVLVEKILNVYGQEEFLETVIPISK